MIRDTVKNQVCPEAGKCNNSTCHQHSFYGQPKTESDLKEEICKPAYDYFPISSGNKNQNSYNNDGYSEGLEWKVYLVPDDFDSQYNDTYKILKRVPEQHYDAIHKCIKPRRGTLMATYTQFMSSLRQVTWTDEELRKRTSSSTTTTTTSLAASSSSSANRRRNKIHKWIFSGVLNGWPALTTLELLSIEYKRAPFLHWSVHWSSSSSSSASSNKFTSSYSSSPSLSSCISSQYNHIILSDNIEGPTIPNYFGITQVRARLRAPAYTAHGWSASSPGYVFWFEGNETRTDSAGGGDRLLYGTNILKQWKQEQWMLNSKKGSTTTSSTKTVHSSPKCVRVHQISHRYAMGNKQVQIRDYLTYHSVALLEWDHGRYCTVVELAYLGGVGGYNGRANWIEDKDAIPSSGLYKAMPPEMIHPWKENRAEIRCYDINVQSHTMFLMYMQKYTGKDQRFLDVHSTFSHDVRLTFCHREHIAQYLINYIRRIRSYSTLGRNCQTFAADVCAFLAGKRDVQPYHPINRGAYRNQTHTFLYDSTMYYDEDSEGDDDDEDDDTHHENDDNHHEMEEETKI